MEKGICLGNDVTIELAAEQGLDVLFVPSVEISLSKEFIKRAKKAGFKKFIINISCAKHFENMDKPDAYYKSIIIEYAKKKEVIGFYLDEPYAVLELEAWQLIHIRDFIKAANKNSKFIIGDIRKILEPSYVPIPDIFYTYTSYISTWVIFGKPIKFGLPDQSRTIKRLYKKFGKQFFMIWIYGQNKIFCHPDEYRNLLKTAESLDLPYALIYFGDGGTADYMYNTVPLEEAIKNIKAFIKGENPYNIFSWLGKFFSRLFFIVKNKITNGRWE